MSSKTVAFETFFFLIILYMSKCSVVARFHEIVCPTLICFQRCMALAFYSTLYQIFCSQLLFEFLFLVVTSVQFLSCDNHFISDWSNRNQSHHTGVVKVREEAKQRLVSFRTTNRPFSYSKREPGSSEIFMRKVRSRGVSASLIIVQLCWTHSKILLFRSPCRLVASTEAVTTTTTTTTTTSES